MVLSVIMKKKLLLKTYPTRLEFKKRTPFMNKMAIIDTMFTSKTAEQPYPHIPV